MRACFALILATLSFVAIGQTARADPFDVAFWEQVIESPTCRADEFVAFLKDPRAWAHCPRRGERCFPRHGRLIYRTCGAGMDVLQRTACFRSNPGTAGREAALRCLSEKNIWTVGRTIWLEEYGDDLPVNSRLRLSSEPEREEMPEAFISIASLPPRLLGLSEQDLKDDGRIFEFLSLSAQVEFSRVEAMIAALPAAHEELLSRSANISDRRGAIKMINSFRRHWGRPDGDDWLKCSERVAAGAVLTVRKWPWWTSPCPAAMLSETAARTFRWVEITRPPN